MLYTSEMTLLLAKETVDVLRTEELRGHKGRGQTARSCNALGITRALQHPACSSCARCLPQGGGFPCAEASSQGCGSDKSMQRETSFKREKETKRNGELIFFSISFHSTVFPLVFTFLPNNEILSYFFLSSTHGFFPGIGSIVLSLKLEKNKK